MTWNFYTSLKDIPSEQLYEVLKLRQDIFIIEQNCIYDDIDGKDDECSHLLLLNDNLRLVGYLRIVPAGKKFNEVSLGRIVIREKYRGKGMGEKLIRKGIQLARDGETTPIKIEAQAHLENYYARFGFKPISETYKIDGIPHLLMVL